MSLLSEAKKEVSPESANSPKKSNSDYQKRAREHQFNAACAIRDFLKEKKIALTPELQAEMDFLCKEKKAGALGSAFGKPVFYKLFGNTPKIGDKITALKVFEETGKGFAEMRSLMKKWADKQGITVVYDDKTKSYEIKAGTISAYVEA